jgi:mycothiol synthase
LLIREFGPSDSYQPIVEIHNANFPDMPAYVEYYEEMDKNRNPKCKHKRWLAEKDNQIIGTGLYMQYISRYDPKRFDLWIIIKPQFQLRGIGSALYEKVFNSLKQFRPKLLATQTREDNKVALDMINRRGFDEKHRGGMSELDTTEFDFSPYEKLEENLQKHGIEIKTMRQLESDPNRDRKLYDLDWEVTRDEPTSGNDTQVDFETFVREGLNNSERLLDGYFVAVDGDKYVGLCMLNHNKADNKLMHGITGIRRQYRRKGIALALKVRAVRFAYENGHPAIQTSNEVNNRPILSINERLGFKRLPDWVYFEKTVR